MNQLANMDLLKYVDHRMMCRIPGKAQQKLLLFIIFIFFVLLQACGDEEDVLRPKVNKYDLFKDQPATAKEGKALLSESAATAQSTLVVQVEQLFLVDSSFSRGGSQYLYHAGSVKTIIKTTGNDSLSGTLLFISPTKFSAPGGVKTLFLDTIVASSPLRQGGVKYKWLRNAPLK